MRKQKHPTLWAWGSRRGRPWTSDDETCAKFLRHCGMTDEDIGEILNRSARSIEYKIGYERDREHVVIYQAARPALARELGRWADSYLATTTAGHA